MKAIFIKEIKQFFNSIEGYLAIGFFFTISSLLIWLIPSELNILINKQANLLPFFLITPWILLILIPAITMKMISAESLQKTNILLFTKPISTWNIINAKYLASVTISLLSILPTITYVFSIWTLSEPRGNIDFGEMTGSYIGVFLLIIAYNSIGIFASTISKNTVICFILSILLILFTTFGLNYLGLNLNNTLIKNLSIIHHYESISRGVLDIKNIIYFTSVTIIFLHLSSITINKYKS